MTCAFFSGEPAAPPLQLEAEDLPALVLMYDPLLSSYPRVLRAGEGDASGEHIVLFGLGVAQLAVEAAGPGTVHVGDVIYGRQIHFLQTQWVLGS